MIVSAISSGFNRLQQLTHLRTTRPNALSQIATARFSDALAAVLAGGSDGLSRL
jgi:hypothetical protein